MSKEIKLVIVSGLIVGTLSVAAFFFSSDDKKAGLVGFGGGSVQTNAKEFNQVGLTGSRSQQGAVTTKSTNVHAIEITSVDSELNYLSLFDMVIPVVPTRAASQSSTQNIALYAGSKSWSSDAQLAAKPISSYLFIASPSLVTNIPIPGATASSAPTIVRVDSTMFSPALSFTKGLTWGISSDFANYSSVGINTDYFTVKIIYTEL